MLLSLTELSSYLSNWHTYVSQLALQWLQNFPFQPVFRILPSNCGQCQYLATMVSTKCHQFVLIGKNCSVWSQICAQCTYVPSQLPGRLFSPNDISKKTVPPLFIAYFNWYGFLWPPRKISGCVYCLWTFYKTVFS